jgi:hypothetical protein
VVVYCPSHDLAKWQRLITHFQAEIEKECIT